MKLLLLAWLLISAGAPFQTDEQIAHKRRHLDLVLEELARRDVSHLTPAQRTARKRALNGLRAYAVRGRFPVSTRFPGWETPYFIDDRGTRCALAQVIDESGHADLVRRLARQDNHAYVSGLTGDRELLAWLDRHGLTADEAAFIQGPGFNRDFGPREEEIDRTPPPVVRDPQEAEEGHDGGEATPGTGDIEKPNPTPRRDIDIGRRTRVGRRADSTWETWWVLNRDVYANVRERYHGAKRTILGAGARSRRPDARAIKAQLLPMLARFAGDGDARATALMAWARTATLEKEREQVVAACLDVLRDGKQKHRRYALLALGVARDASAFDPLVDVMLDLPDGRKALGQNGAVPEPLRALAALGLGALDDGDAIEHLVEVCSMDPKRATPDVRASAVASLGVLAHHKPGEVRPFLEGAFKQASWPAEVRAALPAALGRAGALAPLIDHLRRFRGSARVRQSCAVALGAWAPHMTLELVEVLEASALRDTDPLVRRFASLALGEVAWRDRGEVNADARDRAFRFFRGALQKRNTQAADRAWQFLATGLFAQRFPKAGVRLEKGLARMARSDRSVDGRASAMLALGICRRADLLAKLPAKSLRLRAVLAEARGIAGDPAASAALLADARTHSSPDVRYGSGLALGLLGERAPVAALAGAIATERSAHAQAALMRVAGEIGDREALAPLLTVLRETRDTTVRRRALAGLGLLGDPGNRPWNAVFARGRNFAALTPAMLLVLSLF